MLMPLHEEYMKLKDLLVTFRAIKTVTEQYHLHQITEEEEDQGQIAREGVMILCQATGIMETIYQHKNEKTKNVTITIILLTYQNLPEKKITKTRMILRMIKKKKKRRNLNPRSMITWARNLQRNNTRK